ncbi:epididymal protein 13-like [Octodon degus]|uniref:Epididymal protein 13-like n=1 Tax=Octodon degus TaxID=10160 RepID=A0A6P6DWE9_OCTDE|nr:epididymal protein 13-like [Octodon degus]XP_023564293.1 epididymal protein 13-like [Octodon degus]
MSPVRMRSSVSHLFFSLICCSVGSWPPALATPDRNEEEMKILRQILGLLSLQVLSDETNDCKEVPYFFPLEMTG